MDNYICKIANLDEINEKWDYEIEKHPDDSRWKVWKEQFVTSVKRGNRMGHIILLVMRMQRHFIKKLDLPVLVSAERGQFYP